MSSFPEIKIVSEPDFKDGDDNTVSELENITIRIVDNGYVVRIEDEEEITEILSEEMPDFDDDDIPF